MPQREESQLKASKTITRPSHALESVDNALHQLQMLRDVGALCLKDAAKDPRHRTIYSPPSSLTFTVVITASVVTVPVSRLRVDMRIDGH